MNGRYILVDRLPVPCDDLDAWAKAMRGHRHVADERIGRFRVSTVFLGLDHGFGEAPLLFETMIFGESLSEGWCERCSTWEEAEAMHKRGVEEARRLNQEHPAPSGEASPPNDERPTMT